MAAATQIPGIYFMAEAPARAAGLPGMDVAGFVGFAASGPLDTPVALSGLEEFEEIFGGDLELAWDARTGRKATAHLRRAVQGFFQQGGRRCWAVRVAGDARANQFVIPGLLRPSAVDGPMAALLEARSEGSWSDALRVNASLRRQALSARSGVAQPLGFLDGGAYSLALNPGQTVVLGDLLLAEFSATGDRLYLPVEQFTEEGVFAPRGYWFEPVEAASPQAAGLVPGPVWRLDRRTPEEAAAAHWSVSGNRFRVELPRTEAAGLLPGAFLRLDSASGSHLLQIERTSEAPDSPPGAERIALSGDRVWSPHSDAAGRARNSAGAFQLWLLTADLVADGSRGRAVRLERLGLTPRHVRYLGRLFPDAELFRRDGRPRNAAERALAEEVSRPRFPLAGRLAEPLLPVGLAPGEREDFAQPPTPPPPSSFFPQQPETALERDGLTSLSPEIFLDPDLKDLPSSRLLTEAFAKRYPASGGEGETLKKLHALIGTEEASIVSIPDAVHPGWEPAGAELPPLAAPDPFAIDEVTPGSASFRWGEVAGAGSYEVQESEDRLFARAGVVWLGETVFSDPIDHPAGCPRERFYRVRAVRAGSPGPWSATLAHSAPRQDFSQMEDATAPAPRLEISAPPDNRLELEWGVGMEPGFLYVLETSFDPEFASARVLQEGPETSFTTWRLAGKLAYYRVRVSGPEKEGPWSRTVLAGRERGDLWLEHNLEKDASALDRATEDLARLTQALLRFCHARGDIIAVLSVPEPFREREVGEFHTALLERVREERAVLSYGALYHPWLVFPAHAFPVPPDGCVAGLLARIARGDGAWISPANQEIRRAVAVRPVLDKEAPGIFYGRQWNLIQQTSRGFRTNSAETLSLDVSLRSISVRRLLILLRRLALREGAALVFEPNNEAFARLVQGRFESILTRMFGRGAFAGATPSESFRVVTDSTVNTPQAVDAGRFITELWVAPSEPLSFLKVQLVQGGAGPLSVGEI